MHLDDQPDPLRARAEWLALVGGDRGRGRPRRGAAAAAGRPRHGLRDEPRAGARERGRRQRRHGGGALAHALRAAPDGDPRRRRAGSPATASRRRSIGRDGVGAHFEAGDAFAWRGELIVGYGPRTEELALKHLATDLGVSVRGFRITHPGMYHMDLGFCPLDDTRAMVCPAAYDDASAAALLALVPEPLVLTEEEALTFCANSIVLGRTIVMPACPDRVRAQLEEWGFEVVVVEVGEFLKGGGAIRCMTNPLDVRLGRDLAPVRRWPRHPARDRDARWSSCRNHARRVGPVSNQNPPGPARPSPRSRRTSPASRPTPRPGQQVYKLSSNENPYPPLPGVVEAAEAAAARMNRYPDMGNNALYAALADRLGVPRGAAGRGHRFGGRALPPAPGVLRARRRGRLRLAVLRGLPDRGVGDRCRLGAGAGRRRRPARPRRRWPRRSPTAPRSSSSVRRTTRPGPSVTDTELRELRRAGPGPRAGRRRRGLSRVRPRGRPDRRAARCWPRTPTSR